LLAFVTGCEWDSKENAAPYTSKNVRGVLPYADRTPASPEAEVATTLTALELRQQYQRDEEARRSWREAQADDSMRHRNRLAQQTEELRRRWDEQAESDRQRKELRQEQRQRLEEQRQRFSREFARRNLADPTRSQQPSQTLDGILQQIQRQQQQQQNERMPRHQNTRIMGGGVSNS
jgi:hypothetical protein